MYGYKPILSKDFILKNISEEEIFKKYLGIEPDLQEYFTNPLRDDENPDCKFYINKQGRLKFHDIPMGWNWDCFNVVERLFNCTFSEALKIIAIDFGIVEGNKRDINLALTVSKSQKYTVSYRVKRKNWDEASLKYWKQYDVGIETLIHFGVSPIHILFVNRGTGLEETYRWRDSDIGYVYHFGGYNYKFYFPLRQKPKPRFIQSSESDILQGYSQLPESGEILIITKSFKDVICLSMFDIPAVAPLAEGFHIKAEVIDKLKLRFNRIYSLMDFDKTGIKSALRLKQFDIPYLFFTNGRFGTEDYGAKDFSDFLANYGNLETLDLINYVRTRLKV